MKIKVYQLIRKAFDSKGYLIPKEQRTNKIVCIGTVVCKDITIPDIEDDIWDSFNWTCWYWKRGRKDSYLHGIRKGFRAHGLKIYPNSNSRGFCNSDIFFKLGDKWMVAKPFGWDTADSYEEAVVKLSIQHRF